MRGTLATFNRELKAYFYSPLAYAVLTIVLLINGALFAIIVSFLADPRFASGRPLDIFFNTSWFVFLFIVPLLTMRLLSEERKTGTIEVLMTAPVTEGQVVLGKYLAALVFYLCLWLPTLLFPLVLSFYSEIDWGTVAAGYLGLAVVGAFFLAAGLLASAFSRSQIVAGLLAFAFFFVLFLVFGSLQNLVTGQVAKELFTYLDVSRQMEEFAKGIVDTRFLVYDLSAAALFLYLTSRVLAANKWR